ncbi:MAG: hypothetical protein ACTSYU_08935 [Promethearchaeota archaeon]
MSKSQLVFQSFYDESFSFNILAVTHENYPDLRDFLIQFKFRTKGFLNHDNLSQFLQTTRDIFERKAYEEFRKFCIILQHKNEDAPISFSTKSCQENLLGVIICQHIPRQKGQLHTEWVNISWIIDQNLFSETLAFTQESNFSALLSRIESQFQGNIAYLFSNFPENKHTKAIIKGFKKKNSDFEYCYYPFDEKINQTKSYPSQYRGNYGFFWENDSFDPLETPPDLNLLWKSANNLYQRFREERSVVDAKITPYWKSLIARKQYLLANYPEISEKLSNFKNFMKNQLDTGTFLVDNLDEKMEELGLRLNIEEIPSPGAHKLVTQYKLDLIINFIESIPSQGSLYNKILDDSGSGQLSLKLFDIDHLVTFFGKFLGILTLQIDSGENICLGYVRADYKKDIKRYSRQFMNGIVIPEMFRGFSLAKIFALSGMNRVLKLSDIFYEDATIYNEGTKMMISTLGFRDFGVMKNIMYGYNPFRKKITALNMMRKYMLNPNFVKEQRQLARDMRKTTSIGKKS